MRIDLHTHSNRSDGTLTPRELVAHAHDVGLDVLALTDHDTTEGWASARAAAAGRGLRLLPGIEVSCRYAGAGVHLLAYLLDPAYPPLVEELDRVLDGRNARLPRILARLNGLGIDIEIADVARVSGDAAATGRPHVADALVAAGAVRDRDEAFARFLGPGGPAYVDRYGADLVTMIGTVRDAGGVSVLAHPWARRHRHDALDRAGLAELREAGLAGVEVDHEDHDADARARLRALAEDLGLLVTGSSDFHGTGKAGHDIGCNTTDPAQLDRLLELADTAAARAGRGLGSGE